MGLEAGAIALIQIGASLTASVALRLLQKPPKQDAVREATRGIEGEGAPLQKGYGERAVVQPRVIWERRLKPTYGSNGVPRQRAHIMLAIAESPKDSGVNQLERLFAQEKAVYSTQPDLSVSSNLLEIERFEHIEHIPGQGPVITNVSMDIISPSGGPDLSVFKSGIKAVVGGSDESSNNGTFTVLRSTRSEATGETTLRLNNLDAADDTAGSTVTIDQALPVFAKRDMRSVTPFNGNANQTPSTFIEGFEGDGNVPAFHNTFCILLDKFFLNDYGAQIPPFRAVYSASAAPAELRDVVEEVALEAHGVDSSMIDVSGISLGTYVRGFTTGPDQSPQEKLEQLSAAFLVLSQERDGKIHFFTRDNATEVEIDIDDLVAHDPSDTDLEYPFTRVVDPNLEVPSRVTVQFFDEEKGFTQGSQTEPQSDADNDDEEVLNLPITMTGAEAAAIAARVKWLMRANKRRVRFFVDWKYLRLQENDIAKFTDARGKVWRILLDRVDRREDGIIECEGIEEQASALSFTRSAEPPLSDPPEIYIPPYMQLEVLDVAPLSNAHLHEPGIYWATSATDPRAQFTEAILYASTDGTNFTDVDFTSVEVPVGIAITALGDGTPGLWDDDSTVRVAIPRGELESATEREILTERRNLCAIGGEICCFRTATLVSSDTNVLIYDLSGGILRGLRNTGAFVSNHSANERFVLLDQQAYRFFPVDVAIGEQIWFKSVPVDGVPDDFPSKVFTFAAENAKPWAPWDLRGDRRASTMPIEGTWLYWRRRTRALVPFLGSKDLVESVERYRIQILDSAGAGGGSVVYTREVEDVDRLFLSRAIQESAPVGLTFGDPIDFIVEQWGNDIQAWGHAIEGTAL